MADGLEFRGIKRITYIMNISAVKLLSKRFKQATNDELRRRTILRVVGERGTGKTRLGLTAPGPTLYQSFDYGLEGVIEPFVKEGKEIYPQQYDWHPGGREATDDKGDFNQDYAIELRKKFEEDFYYALDNSIRTIVWDKETDIWEMYRYAEFGGPSDAPKDYPALNQRYMSIINAVKSLDVNLILIQGMRDEWITKKRTKASGQVVDSPGPSGRRVPGGFSRLDELVFAEVCCVREGRDFYYDFYMEGDPSFGKSRQNVDLCGQRFGQADLGEMTFVKLGTLLINDSEESDWQ